MTSAEAATDNRLTAAGVDALGMVIDGFSKIGLSLRERISATAWSIMPDVMHDLTLKRGPLIQASQLTAEQREQFVTALWKAVKDNPF